MQVKTETEMAKLLDRVFLAALLMTGNMKAAETAVLDGIAVLDSTLSSESLLLATLKATIERGEHCSFNYENIPPDLPVELRRVLLLNTEVRVCFVLRALLGMPSKICSDLLRVPLREIEQSVSHAMQRLARLENGDQLSQVPAITGHDLH